MISTRSRLIDLASVAALTVGGLCYATAYSGMQALRGTPHDPGAPLFAGYTRYVRLNQLSYLGIAAIAIGIALAVYAASHARRARGNPTP